MIDAFWTYATHLDGYEAAGLVFGLVCVWLLIKQNIWTWPTGIAYVLVSFVVFYEARLYADLALHVIFLGLNLYGWYYWLRGGTRGDDGVPVTTTAPRLLAALLAASALGIAACGALLATYTDAALPYWDSTTSVLSIAAIWLQARKKLESWIVWLVVDVLATGIYVYKEIFFYAVLYLVYIGLAVAGFRAWRRAMQEQPAIPV